MLKKICFLLLCVFFIGCTPKGPIFHDIQGKKYEFSQLNGKWIIINFWAPWCDYCVKEVPELNRFYQDNKDPNVLLFGVNYDLPGNKELKDTAQKAGIQYPVLIESPAEAWSLGEIYAIPVTFIIDPQGRVVKTIDGPTTEKMLLTVLQSVRKFSSNAKT